MVAIFDEHFCFASGTFLVGMVQDIAFSHRLQEEFAILLVDVFDRETSADGRTGNLLLVSLVKQQVSTIQDRLKQFLNILTSPTRSRVE